MLRTQRILAAGFSLLFKFIPAAIFAVWSVDCLAAPSVSGVSGTITDGSQITITGSGFGSGGDSPLLWDNFENGTPGATLNANPQVGAWAHGSSGPGAYSTSRPYSGTKSLRSSHWAGTSYMSVVALDFSPPEKLFQSFRFLYLDNGLNNGSGGGYKVSLWFGNSGYGEYGPAYQITNGGGWWVSQMSTSQATGEYAQELRLDDVEYKPAQGVWHQLEIQGKQSGGNVADGSVEMWMDGVKMYNHHGITRDNAAYSWSNISFFSGVVNTTSPVEVYIDDVYLDDSWARVIVSDSATFAGAKIQEIQRPISWANGSAVVKLNKGAFADFSTLYLYVVDNNGNANPSGFKLNGVEVVAPKPPSSVTIQ